MLHLPRGVKWHASSSAQATQSAWPATPQPPPLFELGAVACVCEALDVRRAEVAGELACDIRVLSPQMTSVGTRPTAARKRSSQPTKTCRSISRYSLRTPSLHVRRDELVRLRWIVGRQLDGAAPHFVREHHRVHRCHSELAEDGRARRDGAAVAGQVGRDAAEVRAQLVADGVPDIGGVRVPVQQQHNGRPSTALRDVDRHVLDGDGGNAPIIDAGCEKREVRLARRGVVLRLRVLADELLEARIVPDVVKQGVSAGGGLPSTVSCDCSAQVVDC